MILPIENNAPTLIRRVPILLFFLILILSAPAPNGYAAAIPSDLRAIHVLNRLAFGPSPGDLEHVKSVGVDKYIDEQLSPNSISLPATLINELDTLSTLRLSAPELFVDEGPRLSGLFRIRQNRPLPVRR